MSNAIVNDVSNQGAVLQEWLSSDNSYIGGQPSYELCKAIFEYVSLAGKIVEKPVRLAQSKKRTITIQNAPEDILVKAFNNEWEKLGCDHLIRDVMFLKRIYGIAGIVYGSEGIDTNEPIDPWKLHELGLYFNKLDPLNMAGSAVMNQNPNSPDFQKPKGYITAAGQQYHPSRSVTMIEGTPIYISYTASAFGFSGRSVFQRALYPLKSYCLTMVTDNMVSDKAGLLVVKQKQTGSIVNNIQRLASGFKRTLLKEGRTGNVITIDREDSIESVNMQNIDTAMKTARDNIIANIATGTDVPAILLKDEAYAAGFSDGDEDTKAVVQYIQTIRDDMKPLYNWFDNIVQHKAWTPELFETIKAEYPDLYGDKTYKQAFYSWVEEFTAEFPSLMEEPDSEKVKVDEIKMRGVTEILRTLLPIADPENKSNLVQWAADNLNNMKTLFQNELNIDYEALAAYTPPEPMAEPKEPKARD